MKKVVKKLILCFGIILLISMCAIYTNATTSKVNVIEKSEEFEKWEKLDEEERKQTIQPLYSTLDTKSSVKRSKYNQLLRSSETSETDTYSLRGNLKNIYVKNQRKTGSCWAFSFTSVLETTISKKFDKAATEYSPMHIEYKASEMYTKNLGEGGNSMLALAYSTNGYGPVYENDLSFESVYSEENNSADTYYLTSAENVDLDKTQRARVEDATLFANIYKSYGEDYVTYKDSNAWFGANTYSEEDVAAMRSLVKEHIKQDGAVDAVLYSDIGINASGSHISTGGYYNATTKAYYCNSSIKTANHAVTIVGYDDGFSKENFAEGNQPLNDGAYIVLNSWGEEFGDGGYFYVSYDDVCIEQLMTGINSVTEYDENTENSLKTYKYDELGMSGSFYLVNDEQTAYLTSGYVANVFTRENTQNTEYLSEVGVFIAETQGVEVYVDPVGDNLKTETLVASYTGTNALEPGYHTLKLASPIQLTGTKFVVKIKYINDEKVAVPVECDLYASGLSSVSTMFDKATSSQNQSYISKDGTNWVDMYNYQLDDTYTLKETNACIKAFTFENASISTVSVESVSLDKEQETIEVEGTTTLLATVLPENATNKNVTWVSLNENVATVNEGLVTGISEGTTTITVTTEDGNLTDTCTITVEPKKVTPSVVNVESVQMNKETVTIKEEEKTSIEVTILPENATNKNVTWTSSNENVATVNEGLVTGISEGTTTITVTTEDGNLTDTCTITVEPKEETPSEVRVTKISLDKETLTMQVDDTTNLVATIYPENATNKNVTWKSSNTNVATITAEGIIEAVSKGITTITATTQDGGFSATCELTVNEKTNIDDEIYEDNDKIDDKEDTNIGNVINGTNTTDTTIADKVIPNTGIKIIRVIFFIVAIISLVLYKKYRSFDGVK